MEKIDEFSSEKNEISTNSAGKNELTKESNKIRTLKEEKIENDDLILIDKQFFKFKKHIAYFFVFIYFSLSLINMPSCPVKSGEGKFIKDIINSNVTGSINILIQDFKFYEDETETKTESINQNSSQEKKILSQSNTREFTGYLLQFKSNKIYLLKWLIGFSCLFLRCYCFMNSKEKLKFRYLNMPFLDKVICLIFPLANLMFDIKYNIRLTKIKNEVIHNISITYYIETKNEFSIISYIEGTLPALIYFLNGLINNELEEFIKRHLLERKKKKKVE